MPADRPCAGRGESVEAPPPRRLRIGIDARVVAADPPLGVSRWTSALLQAAAELAPQHEYLLYLDDRPLSEPVFLTPPFRPRPLPVGAVLASPLVWQQLYFPLAAWRDRVDVVVSPYYCGPLVSHAPQVVCLHDISFALFPQDFPSWVRFKPKLLARPASRRAARVVTPSEFSRREILRVYKLPPEKVVIVPPGHEGRFGRHRRPGSGTGRVSDALPFFLFVGTLLPRRQVGLVIEALARLPSSYHLVLAGEHEPARGAALMAAAERWRVTDRVRLLGHVSDEELDGLYQRALALVSPSTYEGFGLPVLEAMRCGLPVIAWDIPVTREVAAEAAVLLPCGDVQGLAAAMCQLATDPAKRRALGLAGKARAQHFSWPRSAAVLLAVLGDVVGERRGKGGG
jgi:glycosyltransferase involved in cell wall biosynthesis